MQSASHSRSIDILTMLHICLSHGQHVPSNVHLHCTDAAGIEVSLLSDRIDQFKDELKEGILYKL
jgi:metal-responsive CopG/Arc/MetJ family transcriptional regulator